MNVQKEICPFRLITRIVSRSAEQTQKFGRDFAQNIDPGTVVALFGDLGSGKTTCIRGICRGLGVKEAVTSPTFTLINEYKGKYPIFHFDFYRIKAFDEFHDMGVEEYFSSGGICLIEWPEKVQVLLPEDHLLFRLAHAFDQGPDARIIEVMEHDGFGN